MFCPQCGQQQVSGELRFCSRCGFPLGTVSHILATGGMLSTVAADSNASEISPRRRGARQGAMLLLAGAVLVPILGVLDSFSQSSTLMDMLPPLAAIICFVGGIVRLLFALIFEQGAQGAHRIPRPAPTFSPGYSPPAMGPHAGAYAPGSALPPAHSDPVPAWRSGVPPSEDARPFSVTDNTTRLLERDPRTQDAE